MKKIIFLIVLSVGFNSYSQELNMVFKYRVQSITYKKRTEKKWIQGNEDMKNKLVVLDLNDNRVDIYGDNPLDFTIVKIGESNKIGSAFKYLLNCIDKYNKPCVIYFTQYVDNNNYDSLDIILSEYEFIFYLKVDER